MAIITIGGHALKECPVSFIESWTADVIDMFYLCTSVSPGFGAPVINRHSLPEPGAILDQDNFLMEAFTIIENALVKAVKKVKPK